MIDTALKCVELLRQIYVIKEEVESNASHFKDLCERCEIFQSVLTTLTKNLEETSKIHEQEAAGKAIYRLWKTLKAVVTLSVEFTRKGALSMGYRVVFRQSYAVQIATLHSQLNQCAFDLNVVQSANLELILNIVNNNTNSSIAGGPATARTPTTALVGVQQSSATTSSLLIGNVDKEKEERQKLLNALKLNPDELSINAQFPNSNSPFTNSSTKNQTVIGQGGFGTVLIGYWRRNKVAIKRITSTTVSTPTTGSTCHHLNNLQYWIENEMLIMNYLGSYPTILQCYGYTIDSYGMNVVLELAPCGSLSDILYNINDFPIIPLPLSLVWLCDIADALCYIHSKQVKHRDIKSENFLVFYDLKLKLCDFELAKKQHHTNTTDHQRGTFAFMAPEILLKKGTSFASDIFAFAITAVQIITRSLPDDNKSAVMLIEQMIQIAKSIPSCVPNTSSTVNSNQSGLFHGDELKTLLIKCVSYDESIKNVDDMRPTAVEVLNVMGDIIANNGNDPRFRDHPLYEYVTRIEQTAMKRLLKQSLIVEGESSKCQDVSVDKNSPSPSPTTRSPVPIVKLPMTDPVSLRLSTSSQSSPVEPSSKEAEKSSTIVSEVSLNKNVPIDAQESNKVVPIPLSNLSKDQCLQLLISLGCGSKDRITLCYPIK